MKHKRKDQLAPANPGGRVGSGLGERAIFLFLFICIGVGIAIGYMLRGITSPAKTAPAAQSVTASAVSNEAPRASLDSAIEPVEAALKADPQNVKLLIKLGNLYYDHHVYSKATVYYQRALQLNPRNVNVRTDLGTAYVYSGVPKRAVAEYQQALAINPRHFQTLFNLGVVYEDGLKDHAHAIATWQKLLKLYPHNPNRNRIEKLIRSAKREEGLSAAVR